MKWGKTLLLSGFPPLGERKVIRQKPASMDSAGWASRESCLWSAYPEVGMAHLRCLWTPCGHVPSSCSLIHPVLSRTLGGKIPDAPFMGEVVKSLPARCELSVIHGAAGTAYPWEEFPLPLGNLGEAGC